MQTRTYRAYSMAQALAAVKRDLGADAVILRTKSMKRGGFLGIGRRTVIELTATINTKPTRSPRTRSSAARDTAPPAPRRAAVSAYAAVADHAAAKSSGSVTGTAADDRARTQQFARELLARVEASEKKATEAAQPVDRRITFGETPPAERPANTPSERDRGTDHRADSSADATREPKMPPAPQVSTPSPIDDQPTEAVRDVARRFVLASAADSSIEGAGEERAVPTAARSQPIDDAHDVSIQPSAASTPRMADELGAIRQMVGQVLQRQTTAGPTPGMPQQLFDMYLKLIAQDVSEDLADQIINEVRAELTAEQLEDEAAVRSASLDRLARCIPIADQPVALSSTDGRPLTIALVGPTGVGKTTTLAKLAASFKLRHNKSVGLITTDTYRIAAVDQLRTYAGIIGLSLEVVLTPAEIRRATQKLRDCDVILIDTAGRSQRDRGRLNELAAFIEAAEPHEVHLVLSSTASEKVLMQEAEAFSTVGVDKVVLTKLDEAVSFGVLINVIRRIDRAFSFFTTGQEVPDHIEISRADRLAALVLGPE